ncbi:MAG: hypothetical protein QXZ09_04915 [Candidatus Methanomethylicaceae archaeon]
MRRILLAGCILCLFATSSAFAGCPDKATAGSIIQNVMRGRNVNIESIRPDEDFKGLCEVIFYQEPMIKRPMVAYISETGGKGVILGRKLLPGAGRDKGESDTERITSVQINQIKGYAYSVHGSGKEEYIFIAPFSCKDDCKKVYQEGTQLFNKSRKSKLFVVVVPDDDVGGSQSDMLVQLYCEKMGTAKGVFCQPGRVSVDMVKKIYASMRISEKLPVLVTPKGEVVPVRDLSDLKKYAE